MNLHRYSAGLFQNVKMFFFLLSDKNYKMTRCHISLDKMIERKKKVKTDSFFLFFGFQYFDSSHLNVRFSDKVKVSFE